MTTAHLFSPPLPPNSVTLGRLVASKCHPDKSNFLDPLPHHPSLYECYRTHHPTFSESIVLDGREVSETETTLTATDITTVDLQNADDWFTRLCCEETVCRWIDKVSEGGCSVYLVVGMRTRFRAATVTEVGEGSHSVDQPWSTEQGDWIFAVLYRNVNINVIPDLPVLKVSSFVQAKTDGSALSIAPGDREMVKLLTRVEALRIRSLYERIGFVALWIAAGGFLAFLFKQLLELLPELWTLSTVSDYY